MNYELMFGCEKEELEQMLEEAKAMFGGLKMFAMSILSDSQEELARGENENARQLINIAKYALSMESR